MSHWLNVFELFSLVNIFFHRLVEHFTVYMVKEIRSYKLFRTFLHKYNNNHHNNIASLNTKLEK